MAAKPYRVRPEKILSRLQDNTDDIIDDAMDVVGNQVKDELRDNMTAEGLYATGEMAASWEYDESAGIIGNTDDGMYGVEFGTPRGVLVPLEELEKWAIAKLDVNERDARAVARAVHIKIKNEGIPQTRYVFRTLDRMVKDGWIAWINSD